MLSTIGRAAIRRVGGGAPKSTNRALQAIWHLQRADGLEIFQNRLAQPLLALAHQRSYATTKAASKAKPKSTSATKSKPKPKAKKAATRKTKKAAKKPKPKAKPKRKPAKPLTEEEKLKKDIKELKLKALLDGPKAKPSTAWTVLVQEVMQGAGAGELAARASSASAKYKSLSASELESYNHVANQNKVANEAAVKKWVESHTPDEINTANNARRRLRVKTGHRARYPLIADERLPKRPTLPRFMYFKKRHASGDLKGIPVVETGKLLNKEWNELSAGEKKQYEDLAAADKQRYIEEYKAVFKRDSTAKVT